MKTNLFAVAIATLCLCLFATSAFADPPTPKKATRANLLDRTCVDDDDDGFCASPDDESKNKGWDCDDDTKSIHPGAKEVWDDGIDQNCDKDPTDDDDTGDSVTPPASLLKPFHVSPSDHPAILILMKELAACDASSECHLDKTAGKLPTRMNEGSYFLDTNCDGAREVIDQDAKDKYDADKLKGIKCQKAPSCHHRRHKAKTAAVQLPGGVTPTAAPAQRHSGDNGGRNVTVSQVLNLQDVNQAAIAKAQSTGDVAGKTANEAKDLASQANTTANEAKRLASEQAELVKSAGVGLEGLKKDLTQETADRKADVRELKTRLGKVEKKQDAMGKVVDLLQKNGAFVQLGVGGGLLMQRPLGSSEAGVTSRGTYAPGVRFSGNVGVSSAKGSLALIGVVSPVWDSGPSGMESGLAVQVGAEKLMKFGRSLNIGGHALYQQHTSGGSALSPNAVSRGVGVGLTVASIGDDQPHVGVQFRVNVGYEWFGSDSIPGYEPLTGGAPFLGVSLDLLAGLRSNSKPAKVVALPPPPPPADADEGEDTEGDEAE